MTRSHLINTAQVIQYATCPHRIGPRRRETAAHGPSQGAEYSSETIYEIGSNKILLLMCRILPFFERIYGEDEGASA